MIRLDTYGKTSGRIARLAAALVMMLALAALSGVVYGEMQVWRSDRIRIDTLHGGIDALGRRTDELEEQLDLLECQVLDGLSIEARAEQLEVETPR